MGGAAESQKYHPEKISNFGSPANLALAPTVLGPARTPEEVKDMFLSFQAIKANFLEGTRGEDISDQLQNGPSWDSLVC